MSTSRSEPCPAGNASPQPPRAVYFGARVLILDEPTSALGVRQSALVLKNIQLARQAGHAVFSITHSPAHAMLVGDS